jgi:hypothetical protein
MFEHNNIPFGRDGNQRLAGSYRRPPNENCPFES